MTRSLVTQARMTYSTAEGREPRLVVSDGNSHLGNVVFFFIIINIVVILAVIVIIVLMIPDDVFNALGCEDEEEEEEEVGGGVADELQEGLPHHLVSIFNVIFNRYKYKYKL